MGTDEVVDNARSCVRSATACLGDGDNDDVLCRTVGKHVRREVERRQGLGLLIPIESYHVLLVEPSLGGRWRQAVTGSY